MSANSYDLTKQKLIELLDHYLKSPEYLDKRMKIFPTEKEIDYIISESIKKGVPYNYTLGIMKSYIKGCYDFYYIGITENRRPKKKEFISIDGVLALIKYCAKRGITTTDYYMYSYDSIFKLDNGVDTLKDFQIIVNSIQSEKAVGGVYQMVWYLK